MGKLTPPARLEELAATLLAQERHLRRVLDRLEAVVKDTDGKWEGNTADAFRRHVGPKHRQFHLEKAITRLHLAAGLARAAAAQNHLELHPLTYMNGAGHDHAH